jgi:REP element-mobilizing transposase RayT
MPDHVHWLVQLGQRQGLSQLVQRLKSDASRRLHRIGVGGGVWARSFHDHALRAEEDLKVVARYIIANPMRAGLVDCIGDYPHWDAVWL